MANLNRREQIALEVFKVITSSLGTAGNPNTLIDWEWATKKSVEIANHMLEKLEETKPVTNVPPVSMRLGGAVLAPSKPITGAVERNEWHK